MNRLACIVASRHPDPEKTPKAAPGLQTCRGHRAKVERMIAEMPLLYDDLGLRLHPTSGSAVRPYGSRGTATVTVNTQTGEEEVPTWVNSWIMEARDEIHAELVRFVRHVAEERSFTLPAETVPAMATWLTVSADWLCAQPDADETHDNLDRLTRSCTSLAFPSGRRRFTIPGVTCLAPLACDVFTRQVWRCDGSLVAYLTPADDLELPSEIACDTCGLEVPARQWYAWAQSRDVA